MLLPKDENNIPYEAEPTPYKAEGREPEPEYAKLFFFDTLDNPLELPPHCGFQCVVYRNRTNRNHPL